MVSVVSTKFKLLTSGKSKLWIAIVMLSISFLVIMPAGDFCFRVQKSVDASHKEMRVILKMRQDGTNKPSRYSYSKSTRCFNKSKDVRYYFIQSLSSHLLGKTTKLVKPKPMVLSV